MPKPPLSAASRQRARVVPLVYAGVAAAWIVATDLYVEVLGPPAIDTWQVDALKGLGFVVVTAVLLHLLMRRYLGEVERTSSRLELLARRSPDVIFRYRLGPVPKLDFVSPAVAAVTGYSVDEMLADPELPLRVLHPDEAAAVRRELAEPGLEGGTRELRCVRRDGAPFWVEVTVAVVQDGDGRPVAVEGIARDVTQRRERDERRALLEAAVEATGEMVIITDRAGTIRYVNPAFEHITGYAADAAVGQTPRLLKSNVQGPSFYARMWRTLLGGRTFHARFVNRRADGTLYSQESTITPVPGLLGGEAHFVAVARDVSEEERLAHQLEAAGRAEAVGQMAAGVAHDFRNLLTVLQAKVEEAGERRGEAFPAEELAEIGRTTERGMELVRRLLTVGRPEELRMEPIEVGPFLAALAPTLKALLPDWAALEIHHPDEDAHAVLADRVALERVLVNLAANARDALREDGRLRVEVSRSRSLTEHAADLIVGRRDTPPGGWIRVAFTDDGTGIAPGAMKRLFEPYFTTKGTRGTGLGMAMVARLVRLHEGTVTVTSTPGRGTTVAVHLPADTSHAPEEAALLPGAEAPPRGAGERILVVEDEDAVRALLVRSLNRLGYTTLAAADGDEGLRILEAEGTAIRLVITDLSMPGRGGRDLHREMGALGLEETPVIFTSGYTVAEVAHELPAGSATLFLEKPWTARELATRVHEALRSA